MLHDVTQRQRTPPNGGRREPHLWTHLALAGAVVVSTIGCGARQIPPDLGMTWGASVKDITANPVAAAGKIVTVSGEVNQVFGPRWFSIGGEGFGGGEELLVVGPTRVPSILDSLADSGKVMNDIVQVTGRVRVFDEDAIEREIGADLEGDLFDTYDGKAVVVMDDLDITPRVDVIPAVAVPVPVPVVPIADEVVIVTATDRPSLVGRPVALLGAKVLTVVGPSAFWVGPSADKQLFVAMDSAAVGRLGNDAVIRAGQTVSIAGVVRAVPSNLADVRAAWSLSAANEVVLSREQVYLSASDVAIVTP